MATIKPELGGGFRDYLPADMIPRQRMLEKIQKTFEKFGFLPLDTPGVEREEILTGGDPNFRMLIFRLRLGSEREDLALRFDLTVPLARVIAAYPQAIPKPFKRYQIGKVWRGEKPQAGRFREFIQFDADIVGAPDMMADAEIIALIYETMKELGFNGFVIKVNNRKVLNGLCEYAGFPKDKTQTVFRSIDKLDKFGWDKVREELTAKPDNEFDDVAINLSEEQVAAIKSFVELKSDIKNELLKEVGKLMKNSKTAIQGVNELKEIIDYVKALGVPDDKWVIDLSVARGLGYYTGPVFETILTDLPLIGSVFSGGRYDELVARFGTSTIPATGASIGVDRLFAAMEQLKLVPSVKSVSKVMILNFDKECRILCQEIASELRNANIPTEIYLGQESSLKGQLAYAVKQEIPVVIIAGDSELKRGVVQVKDMDRREQKEVPRGELLDKVKSIIYTP